MASYAAPAYKAEAFNCPYCHVYAQQVWQQIGVMLNTPQPHPRSASYIGDFELSWCTHCRKYGVWTASQLVYPPVSLAPPPSADMPEDIRADYVEAADVLAQSPRSSAALLRLAIQKLMPHIGGKGKDINDDIGTLVKKGLRPDVQQALDVVRVIGNNAVHPGEIDIRDNRQTALALFGLVNLIVEEMITRPKEIQALYDQLPDGARKAIEQRDKDKPPTS